MSTPRPPKNRDSRSETWRRLAAIKISVPGLGTVTVEQMLEQVSATGADPQTRNALARECENLAAVLAPLLPSERDEVIERITDTLREAYERNDAQADTSGVRQ